MALKFLILTVVLAGFVNGQFDEEEYEQFGPNMNYRYVSALPLPPLPPLPYMPGMPQPPPLLRPPPLLMPEPLNFGNFPFFPDTPQPEAPTVEEIISGSPTPGGTYESAFVASHSDGWRDDEGKIHRKGGSTVIFNDNGKVKVDKTGDSPPDVVISKKPPFADFPKQFHHLKPKHHKMPHFGGFRPHKPLFEPFVFPKFDPNYVPKKGENYFGTSSSSSSYSSNIDGKKSGGATASVLTNDNGVVDEHKIAVQKSDPKP